MDIKMIDRMKHSPLHNYGGIPGVTSWLIGDPSEKGCVRLFECSRNHQENVHPHSHRFDFEAQVLAGFVINTIWAAPDYDDRHSADEFHVSTMKYGGTPGTYERTSSTTKSFIAQRRTYGTGQTYSMQSQDVHSIQFSKGARVLIFEGPPKTKTSVILEPFVNGLVVPTFRVEPWAFSKE